MPTRNVNLTEELDRFVLEKVQSGRYENANQVVPSALRSLKRDEPQYAAKLAALQTAIEEGDNSTTVKGDVFSLVRKKLKLRAKPLSI